MITENSNATQLIDAVNQSVGVDKCFLRVLSYNIGHFAMGKAPETKINSANADYGIEMWRSDMTTYPYPRSNYEKQLKRWKHRLADIDADIICTPEYNKWFGTLNGTSMNARDVIFDDYPYYYAPREGNTNDYHREAIFTMINHSSQEYEIVEENVTMMNEPQTFVAVSFPIGSGAKMETVYVVCVHAFHNGGNAPLYGSAREAYFNRIIEKYASATRVIICGDFNVASTDEFNAFLEAGYDAVNTSEHPVRTYGAIGCGDSSASVGNFMPNSALDNIIVKGFKIASSRLVNDPLITDHCGLVADLEVI